MGSALAGGFPGGEELAAGPFGECLNLRDLTRGNRAVPESVTKTVRTASIDQMRSWTARAVTAETLDEVSTDQHARIDIRNLLYRVDRP